MSLSSPDSGSGGSVCPIPPAELLQTLELTGMGKARLSEQLLDLISIFLLIMLTIFTKFVFSPIFSNNLLALSFFLSPSGRRLARRDGADCRAQGQPDRRLGRGGQGFQRESLAAAYHVGDGGGRGTRQPRASLCICVCLRTRTRTCIRTHVETRVSGFAVDIGLPAGHGAHSRNGSRAARVAVRASRRPGCVPVRRVSSFNQQLVFCKSR